MRFRRPLFAFAAALTGLALIGGSLVTAQSANAATTTVTQAGYTLSFDPAKVTAGATITKYIAPSGSSLALNIPSSFRINNVDYATVSIADLAFKDSTITSAVIPNTVTNIGTGAFQSSALSSVTLPQSLKTLPNSVFSQAKLTSIHIPESLTSIGSQAFYGNKLESVVIPGSLTSIGDWAFYGNRLVSVVIPGSVRSIGDAAFAHNLLVSLAIPDSVTSIGSQAFSSNLLTSIQIPGSVTSIGSSAFASNRLVSVVIPDSLTSIGDAAFSSNRLVSVVIPESVTSIGISAFYNNLLVSVVIPGSVTSISSYAFSGNAALVDVRFLGAAPLTITSAGSMASLGTASGLVVSYAAEFAVPGGFTTPSWRGYKTTRLSKYVVGFDLQGHDGSVASQSVTYGMKAIAPVVPIASGWTFTGWYTDAAATTKYSFDSRVTSATTLFAGWVRDNRVTDAAGVTYTGLADSHTVTVTGWSGSSSAVVVPSTVTINGEEWLVTAIGDGVFANQNLTSVTLPDGLTSIGAGAFKGNELTELVIPASATHIGSNAFAGNPLTEVSFLGAVPTVGELPFGDGADVVVSYGWEFDASNTAGGFTAPVWVGYTSTSKVPVVFDLHGHGSDVPAQQVSFGEKVIVPAAPTEAGWTFTGWFAGVDATEAYDFDSPVTAATTLHARWAEVVVPDPEPTTPTPGPSDPAVVNPADVHKLESSKNETHLSVPASGTASATAVCPTGSVATDGSVRLDSVDQDTGTFADAVVTASQATADGRGWTGTVTSTATGQVQGKVNVVCLETKTTRVDGHAHDLIVSAPVTADQTWTASGTYDVLVACATGTIPVAPSFAVSGGSAAVTGSTRDSGAWKFTLDVVDAADVSVGVRCLSTTTGETNGHAHTLSLTQLTDTIQVGVGQSSLASLICEVGGTGLVSSRTLSSGLVSRGIDPQSKATLFRVFNPGTSDASATFGVSCLGIDIGSTSPDAIAPVVAPAPQAKLITAKLKLVSVKVKKTAAGAKLTVPVAAGSQVKILAVAKVKGTKIKKGTVLTRGKSAGTKATLKLRDKTAEAVLSGKVKTVRIVITGGGATTSRIVRVAL